MRKDLVQTSSIFGSKNKVEEVENVEQSTASGEEQSTSEAPAPIYCRSLEFDRSLATGNIITAHLFPDTMYGIIYDNHAEAYFACDFDKELIFDLPIYSYGVTAVTQDTVILSIELDYKLQSNEFTQMIIHNHDYTLKPKVDIVSIGELVEIDGKPHSRMSTETGMSQLEEGTQVFYYDKYTVLLRHNGSILYTDTTSRNTVLLSDLNGCYIGFYLEVNSELKVLLHGRKHRMVNRLTVPLALVQDLETEEIKLLTCKNQSILEIEDFYDKDEPIEVVNGVAMLTQESESGTFLNVFTPKHQRIVLEPEYKINTAIVENGLFFERDNVLLLSNGSLIFTSSPSPTKLTIRGKEYSIPCEYVGDL